MIVKFFSNKGGGSASASVDYLLGKDRDRSGAKVIKGDPDLSVSIAQSCDFNHSYSVGCLSFEESEISEETKQELIKEFEKTFFAGLDDDQFNVLWVEHSDKNRVELNFFIPKKELTTEKQLVPYFHKVDFHLKDSFQKVMNEKYKLSNPDDPSKTQLLKNDKKLTGTDREIKEYLLDSISKKIGENEIENRDDLINHLKDLNLEITRETKKSISIKSPESNKNIRLDGEIFKKDFDFKSTLENLSNSKQEFDQNKQKNYESALKTLESYTARRAELFSSKYSLRDDKNEHNRAFKTDREAERNQHQETRSVDNSNDTEHRQNIERTTRQSIEHNRTSNTAEDRQNSNRDSTTDQEFRRKVDSRDNHEKAIHKTDFANSHDAFKLDISDSNSFRNNQDQSTRNSERTSDTSATESERNASRDNHSNQSSTEQQRTSRVETIQHKSRQKQHNNIFEQSANSRSSRTERQELSINNKEREIKNENIRSVQHDRTITQTKVKNGLRKLPVCKLDERKNDRLTDGKFEGILSKNERNNLRFSREIKHDNDRLRSVQRLSERANSTTREQLENVYNRIKELADRITTAVRASLSRDRTKQAISDSKQRISDAKQQVNSAKSAIDSNSKQSREVNRIIDDASYRINRTSENINNTDSVIDRANRNAYVLRLIAEDNMRRAKDNERSNSRFNVEKMTEAYKNRSKSDQEDDFDLDI